MLINAIRFNIVLLATGILVIVSIGVGLLLALASKYLQIKQDERIDKVVSMLPGYNCGACGTPGCSALGAMLVTGEIKSVSACKTIKPEGKQAIKDYLANTPGPDGSTIQVDL